jgi:transposase-like protein
MSRYWADEDKAECIRLYRDEGWTPSQLAKKYGKKHITSISDLLRRNGVKARHSIDWTDELMAEIVRLYTVEGLTFRAIAPKVGISHRSVCDAIRRAGVKVLHPNERAALFAEREVCRQRKFGSVITLPPHLQTAFEKEVRRVRARRGNADFPTVPESLAG